jgi:glyoxylase-like metal-dependent hydrolase (beta-lactamase superfamily II)
VVPRPVWENLTPVNADHTIPLSTTPYLLEKGEWKVVIEPGIGRRWNDKQRAMFHIEHGGGCELTESLRAAGVAPEQITHCLMTHCHWDHLGAACGPDGKPVFPNAEHWTPEIELRAAQSPDHLRRASYRREDVQPIVDAGLMHTYTGEQEILPGLRMVEVGGHSDGVSLVILQGGGATACFWADVVPTANHVHLPFIMAYDMNAAKSWEVRNEWIPRAAREGWWNLLYHDPATPIGKFTHDGKRYGFAPIAADQIGP